MSDWGADHDRVASLNAGLNLEMPPSYTDDQIVYAARDGRIQPEQLDRMAQGVIDLVNKTRSAMSVDDYRFDVDAHDEVAHQAAIESMVLLKNDDDILPVAANAKIAVIGEFARTPRYQGGGSSHITPTKMTSFLDTLAARGVDVAFAPGFTLDLEPADRTLEAEAVETAKNADVVLMFLGLPEAAESEGFDRETLDIPAKQVELLKAVAAENKNIVVVLSNGSVVSVASWAGNAKGILESWLLGQAGGPALADVIFGKVSPSGKLAQTIPMDINDDPSMINWPGEEGHVDYGEGVFVGYRYYDTYDKAVDYPFGFGLSYATFAIDGVNVAKTGANTAHVTATVTNTSDVDAAETVQVYVAPGKAPWPARSMSSRASERCSSRPANRLRSPLIWTSAPSPTGPRSSMTGMSKPANTPSKSARPAATSPPWPSSRSTATARPCRSTNGPRSANGPTIRSAPKSSHPCMRKARPAICRSCPTTT